MTGAVSRSPLVDGAAFAAWRAALAARLGRYREAAQQARAGGDPSQGPPIKALLAAICAGNATIVTEMMGALFPASRTALPVTLAPLESLADWCARTNAIYRVVEPPRQVEIPATARHPIPYRYATEPAAYGCLPGGWFCPGWDYAIGADGVVIADSGYQPIGVSHAHRPQVYVASEQVVAFSAPTPFTDHTGDTAFLSLPMEGHVGHWMMDFLPRLKVRDQVNGPLTFAVPDTVEQKHLDLLALFGVTARDLVLCDAQHRHRFERLHIYRPGPSVPPHPAHAAFLRATLGKTARTPRPGKRLYLVRGNVGTRAIVNEAPFQEVLTRHGFVSADMALLSVGEQQALLADAEIILGTFGSNLLAIYMAPAGARLIVLADTPALDPVLPQTCHMLGLDYEMLLCTPAGRSKDARHAKDFDLIVDCDDLARRLG